MIQDNSRNETTDTESIDEMMRRVRMGRSLTSAMGGPLAALSSIPDGTRILDLACGPGDWALDAASRYPTSEVVGVDISQTMIDYARVSAQIRKVPNVPFQLANVRKTLPFADQTFDVVNARLLAGALPRIAWHPFIAECTRVLHSQGVLLLTEAIDAGVTNSPAYERMQALTALLMWRAGYGFSVDGRTFDVSFMLPHLLREASYSDIQHAVYALEFSKGTDAWTDFYHNALIGYRPGPSNAIKLASVSTEEMEHTSSRMLAEMSQDDFSGMFHFITVAGMKP